jgi:hypothetical protein
MIISLFGDTRVRADKQEAEARLVEQMEPILRSMPGFILCTNTTRPMTARWLPSFASKRVISSRRGFTKDAMASYRPWRTSTTSPSGSNRPRVYKEYYWQDGVKTMDEMTSFFREADHLAESGRSY